MQGFSDAPFKIEKFPFGVRTAAVDLPYGVVMIKVNEGIVMPFNSISSANLLCSYGTMLNECPKMYGGEQKIVINEKLTFPLQCISGLSYLSLKK